MEGKETRFGIVNSALWATATTASIKWSVNSMHDSYTPLGGLVPLWMMHLGEVSIWWRRFRIIWNVDASDYHSICCRINGWQNARIFRQKNRTL